MGTGIEQALWISQKYLSDQILVGERKCKVQKSVKIFELMFQWQCGIVPSRTALCARGATSLEKSEVMWCLAQRHLGVVGRAQSEH